MSVLTLHQLTVDQYRELTGYIGLQDGGGHLPWIFSRIPTILLAGVLVTWCLAFTLIILVYPDDLKSKYTREERA